MLWPTRPHPCRCRHCDSHRRHTHNPSAPLYRRRSSVLRRHFLPGTCQQRRRRRIHRGIFPIRRHILTDNRRRHLAAWLARWRWTGAGSILWERKREPNNDNSFRLSVLFYYFIPKKVPKFNFCIIHFHWSVIRIRVLSKPGLRIRIHFIRIRHFRMNTNPDPDPVRIQGYNDQKLKKITAEKIFWNFFWIKNCNLPIPRPP